MADWPNLTAGSPDGVINKHISKASVHIAMWRVLVLVLGLILHKTQNLLRGKGSKLVG